MNPRNSNDLAPTPDGRGAAAESGSASWAIHPRWSLNASNRASDWYFESIPYGSSTAGAHYDSFVAFNRTAGADSMVTMPLLGWVARLGPNRGYLASFSIARYGAQTDRDPWFLDAGSGVLLSTRQFVTGNNPNDANTPASSAFQRPWVQHLVDQWGRASAGGVRYYLMDNESSIWHSSHRDVHPVGASMEEIRNKVLDYSAMIKSVDPTAQVVGPEEWGWSGYFYSGYDQQYGAANNWQEPYPDRAAHGNMDYVPWLLDQMRRSEQATGRRPLDVFSLHFHPQGGEFGDDVSPAMQRLRNQSTRALWDPNYRDQSWIGTPVNLVPRMRDWVNAYYPGTKLGLTEYSWGAEGDMNGATAQADVLGILGREGVDVACRWTMPDPSTPTYKAIQIYRNYDGSGSRFGDTSVQATVPNPDALSAFAAVRASDGALTVMVVHKSSDSSVQATINVSGFASAGQAQVWQLTSANAITRLAAIPVQSSRLTAIVPPRSITLFVLPVSSGPAPAFTSTVTATPARVLPGANVSLLTLVTCTRDALTNGIVEVEVYNSVGTRVARQEWVAQSFVAGQSRSYSWVWATGSNPVGTYTVMTGVLTSDRSSTLHWNNRAATIVITRDPAQYNFEAGTQGWRSSGGMVVGVSGSSAQAFAGLGSLAVVFNGGTGQTQHVSVAAPATPAGRTITFHVWIPAGSRIVSVQPYALQGAAGGWRWSGNWKAISSLTAGAWNTIMVAVPSTAVTPLDQLGVEFTTNGAWSGTCYVDTVGW